MMAHVMLRNFLREIKEMERYSMIADETRDASGKEQLTISLHWVNKRYDVHEDLIGLVEVTQTDALTVSQAIRDVLLCCILQLGQCRGQAYDGASNMSGRFSGVATRIQHITFIAWPIVLPSRVWLTM